MIGILTFASIVRDCKIVDIPPKLITKEESVVATDKFVKVERSKQPRVISIIPSRKKEIVLGKRLKIGAKHSIVMKNMVIIVPTDKIDSVEFRIMSAKLKEGLSFLTDVD